jgi:Flp pilus assembly protein TadG
MDGTNSNERSRAGWRKLIRRGLKRLARSKAGLTAIEVALVMPVFLLLSFGIIETAILYFIATSLEGQVSASGRQIRTGNVQAAGNPIEEFRNLLCGGLGGLIDCTNVVIDVRNFTNWSAVNYPPFLDEDGNPAGNTFNPGGPGNIVLVRVAYRWTILTPFLGQFFGDGGGQSKQLFSAAAFRNEPFNP